MTIRRPSDKLCDEARVNVLPAGWSMIHCSPDGCVYMDTASGLAVISSVLVEEDGHPWLHVSVSRKSRIPTYDDIALCKDIFVGRERKAIQVFPERKNHVNIHPFCLHLWSRLDGDSLPDFTHGTGMI